MVRIVKVKTENPSVKTFTLDRKIPDSKPGQFLMVWIPGFGEKPLSLSRCSGNVEVTVKKIGEFTSRMHELNSGDLVGVRGPYGNGFTLKGKKACIVGGGIGIAPLVVLAEEAVKSGRKVTAVIGAKTKAELLFENRFRKAAEELVITTDDGSSCRRGFTTDVLKEILSVKKFDVIYACGPEVMMKRIMEISKANKIECQLSLERYMKCGFGICGQCCLDDKGLRVCADGPVFKGKQLIGGEFGSYNRSASGRRQSMY